MLVRVKMAWCRAVTFVVIASGSAFERRLELLEETGCWKEELKLVLLSGTGVVVRDKGEVAGAGLITARREGVAGSYRERWRMSSTVMAERLPGAEAKGAVGLKKKCWAEKMLVGEKLVLLWLCCHDEEIMAWMRGCWSCGGGGAKAGGSDG
ncbi:hypothetical protein Peur_028775 [Populus x canadensis]